MNIRTLSFAALTAALALSACSQKPNNPPTMPPSCRRWGGRSQIAERLLRCRPRFYKEYNLYLSKSLPKKTAGRRLKSNSRHGGSSKQALAVANGLAADVVTMNQTSDIELLVKKVWSKLIEYTPAGQCRTYTSNVVFLVRKGNPKHPRLGRFG